MLSRSPLDKNVEAFLNSLSSLSLNDTLDITAMPSSYTLGKHFEAFVQAQLASGRYGNASEVLRDALRLMEDREKRLQALDAALSNGIADADAGQVHDADAVFDELLARLEALTNDAAIRRAQALVARHVPVDAGLADELIAERHAAADIE